MKKIIALFIITALLFSVSCSRNDRTNPRTDRSPIRKWFPNLDGIETVLWEGKNVSRTARIIPDGTAVNAHGVIRLSHEKAMWLIRNYEWEQSEPPIHADTFGTKKYEGHVWMHSDEFVKMYKPEKIHGDMWFDGVSVWFDITK